MRASTPLRLRCPDRGDVEQLLAWENDPAVWKFGWAWRPLAHSEMLDYVERQLGSTPFGMGGARLLLHFGGEAPMGVVDLYDLNPLHLRAGVGLLIADPESRGRGYGTAALELVKQYAFDHLLLHQLFASVQSDNQHSLSLFTAQGFQPCGTRKHWFRGQQGWTDELLLQCFSNRHHDRT